MLADHAGAEIRMRTVRAVTDCELCFLTKDAVATWRARYPELDLRFRRFSRIGVGERLNMRKIYSRLKLGNFGSYDAHNAQMFQQGSFDQGRNSNTEEQREQEVRQAEVAAAESARVKAAEKWQQRNTKMAMASVEDTQALTTVVCDLLWKVDELLDRDQARDLQLGEIKSLLLSAQKGAAQDEAQGSTDGGSWVTQLLP